MFFRNSPKTPIRVEAKVVGRVEVNPDDYLDFVHVNAHDEDYSGHDKQSFGAVGSLFKRCRFDKGRFDTASFGSGQEFSEYIECVFDGLRFKRSIGNNARFIRCSFRGVDLRGWSCFNAEFIDCTFTGRLQKCIFNGAVDEKDRPWVGREWNEFRGNDFSGAELVDVAFRTGIDLSQQRLPEGPDYLYIPDGAAAIERARRGLADWMPETELQRKALVIVSVLGETVNDGQQQLLLRLPDLYAMRARFPREVVDKVVSLFRGELDASNDCG